MATITAGTSFPTELVQEMFAAVQGRSALAKLSSEKPIPFNGVTEFVFRATGEAEVVAEGAPKSDGDSAVTPVVIKPVKFVFQQRVSDEFVRSGDETRLQYLEGFATGFAKKIARAFDIAAMHGIDPRTGAALSFQATNSLDGVAAATPIDAADPIDDAIEAAIATVGEVNGIALSSDAGVRMAAIKANGIPVYPEYKFGQNPDAFYGMASDVNATVGYSDSGSLQTDLAIVGDFENGFRWGYAANIPLEVIEYGDPDGAGHDLKQYNEVLLRAEAYIGWGILDPNGFAIVSDSGN